eukprot:COSAG02_NODE_3239_length_7114_cov_295.628938_4_plen_97_part_00
MAAEDQQDAENLRQGSQYINALIKHPFHTVEAVLVSYWSCARSSPTGIPCGGPCFLYKVRYFNCLLGRCRERIGTRKQLQRAAIAPLLVGCIRRFR